MTGEEKRNSDEGKNNFLKARGKVAHTTWLGASRSVVHWYLLLRPNKRKNILCFRMKKCTLMNDRSDFEETDEHIEHYERNVGPFCTVYRPNWKF
jgi:hypothetical protein